MNIESIKFPAMTKNIVDEALNHHIISLLEKGHSTGEIESTLKSEGHDASAIRTLMLKLSKIQTGRKQVQGVSLIIAGSILCLLCLLITIMAIYPHSGFYMAMYGLASVGALLVLAGVIMILI